MKKLLSILTSLVLVFTLLVGCSSTNNQNNNTSNQKSSIILATTTSTRDSGLLDYLLPEFKKDTGIEAKVIAVGTGKALQMGVDGEADVLLVHAKDKELEFVKNGDGIERHDVMYNDFVLVGPKDDKVKLKENYPNDIIGALKAINENKVKFISRGDDSGTNKKELKLWKKAGITPEGDFYIEAGKGMGDVLKMTDEMQGYTLTDRATYLSMKDNLNLEILVEKNDELFNQYGVILVNPDKNKNINADGAKKFIEWILGQKAQQMIAEYGKDKFGQALFVPNAS
ncbi:substrate-binding domain-containing protein [Tepidibacter thalassicus]|uniref:Tungstate transport system substrate-binding protein n=1 Tax=Tepidibacter thalassicus DSM 15285 TaxID=1123350 RepID=A0A1M5QSH8_9FIRM|nr:substrate-binding domain-containing protein [Tepidibacter thalassicus]SHH16928.1 tungstate transport system substrate-binding protein [Tepidibacter thalassicus DSM 15285]